MTSYGKAPVTARAPEEGCGGDHERLVAARDEMFGDPDDGVGDAVHIGRERLGDDRDPHAVTMGAASMRSATID